MNPIKSLSSHLQKDHLLRFFDPASNHIIEIAQENNKLAYYIKAENISLRISNDQIPNLLRQFTSLSQFQAFLHNGNTIKDKKRGNQEYSLELLLPCRGGILWIPIFLWLAATGIILATDHWIIRPYLIRPLKERIEKSNLTKIGKMAACFAIEAADIALMTVIGGLCQAGIRNGMAKLASKRAADLATVKFEQIVSEKVVKVAKKGTEARKAVAEGLGFFKKLTAGANDFLVFEKKFIELAEVNGISKTDLKNAMSLFYKQLGEVAPKIGLLSVPAYAIKKLKENKERGESVVEVKKDYGLPGKEDLASQEKAKIREEMAIVMMEKKLLELRRKLESMESQEQILIPEKNTSVKAEKKGLKLREEPLKEEVKTLEEDMQFLLREQEEIKREKRVRLDEKINVGKRLYLMHVSQGYEVDDELVSKIKKITRLSDRSLAKLMDKLKKKYPSNKEYYSDQDSQLSGLSDLSMSSKGTDSSKVSISDESDDRNSDEF